MFKCIKDWLYDKYLEWYVDNILMSHTGTVKNTFLSQDLTGTNNLSTAEVHVNVEEEKMQQGVLTLKRKVNREAYRVGYENYLNNFTSDSDDWQEDLVKPNLLSLTEEEDLPLWKRVFINTFVHKKADILNSKDKERMIDKRIKDYELLQVKRDIRQLNRKLRKAENDKDTELSTKLRKELNELTRRVPRKR